MKERVTVTVEKSLLALVDSSVDGMSVKNRSHAIELLIERGLRYQLPALAVILAGGDPKELLRAIDGRTAIQHNIDLVARAGIAETIIIVPKNSRVREFLESQPVTETKLVFVEEPQPLGTAGCLNLIRERVSEPFLLLNGDEIKDVNLRDCYSYHRQQHGLVTIALTPVADVSQYGVAMMNGSRIVAFIEKPQGKPAPSALVNAGLYICEPTIFAYIPNSFAQLEIDVFPKLAREDKLIGFPFSGRYVDVQPALPERLTNIISELNPLRTLDLFTEQEAQSPRSKKKQ